MGCLHPFPGARHGSGYGIKKFESRLVCVPRRCEWLRNRDVDDLVHERARLSDCGRWQADVQPLLGLPAIIRINNFVWCLRIVVRDVVFEPATAAASSLIEE